MMNIKINKKLLFTSKELINYLKTIKKFSKIDEEILVTITYKHAYQKLNNKDVLIGFPYKESREKEISRRPLLLASEIGKFIKANSEENSPIDSMLVDPENQKSAYIRPLQIKFLGKGKYSKPTTNNFIQFLKEKSNYEKSKISLIISLQGEFNINLRTIATWLTDNRFPFGEVILIRPNSTSGDMEFYQLKPSEDNKPFRLIIPKNEMLKDF